jgi:hypothetical protein
LSAAPVGTFRYTSLGFALLNVPLDVCRVVQRMAEGLAEPRVTYRYVSLRKGEALGNLGWHCDGQQKETEIHRLLCIGPEGTMGEGDVLLQSGMVWEYDGHYSHRPIRASQDTMRFLLRVSQTKMPVRNFWSVGS